MTRSGSTRKDPGRLERVTVLPLRALLGVYRIAISPVLGAQCRFHPSCSRYADEAIRRHGWRGVGLAVWRVLRCHPWNAGGPDPVPERRG